MQSAPNSPKSTPTPPWKLPLVAASFIRLMRERGDVPLFDGIANELRQLHASGLRLALVTSNSADNARRMLGPQLVALFEHCEGRSGLLGKHARIRRVLARTGVDASEALYVGDQLSDLEAARQARVDFGAVAWGYGDIETLRGAGAEQVFRDVQSLGRLALGSNCPPGNRDEQPPPSQPQQPRLGRIAPALRTWLRWSQR